MHVPFLDSRPQPVDAMTWIPYTPPSCMRDTCGEYPHENADNSNGNKKAKCPHLIPLLVVCRPAARHPLYASTLLWHNVVPGRPNAPHIHHAPGLQQVPVPLPLQHVHLVRLDNLLRGKRKRRSESANIWKRTCCAEIDVLPVLRRSRPRLADPCLKHAPPLLSPRRRPSAGPQTVDPGRG